MAVNEADIELLESYLDDELAPAEIEAFRECLSSEPALAAAMDDLRTQRQMRSMFFASLEPTERAVERVVQSVKKSINKEIVWAERFKTFRAVSSLAACLLVGFIGGYGMRGSHSGPTQQVPQSIASTEGDTSAPTDLTSVAEVDLPKNQVIFDGAPVNTATIPTGPVAPNGTALAGYQLNVVDGNNRVVRRFNSMEQAQQFMQQLRMQQMQQQMMFRQMQRPPGQ
jgi:anti-sigma factor RsiW